MRTMMVVALLLAAVLPAAAEEGLVVNPGWTDGFFDGSDHHSSGIDVYISEPDWGNIPEPPPPTPVEIEEKGNMLVEVPRREATVIDTVALAAARRLAITYADGTIQMVTLQQPFAQVLRLTALPAGDTIPAPPVVTAVPAATAPAAGSMRGCSTATRANCAVATERGCPLTSRAGCGAAAPDDNCF